MTEVCGFARVCVVFMGHVCASLGSPQVLLGLEAPVTRACAEASDGSATVFVVGLSLRRWMSAFCSLCLEAVSHLTRSFHYSPR